MRERAGDCQTNHPAPDYDDVGCVFNQIYFVLNHLRAKIQTLKPSI